ncbi:MAG TPA: hypothetical protein VI685_05615 [Candidatus Angelobacter sp.]
MPIKPSTLFQAIVKYSSHLQRFAIASRAIVNSVMAKAYQPTLSSSLVGVIDLNGHSIVAGRIPRTLILSAFCFGPLFIG